MEYCSVSSGIKHEFTRLDSYNTVCSASYSKGDLAIQVNDFLPTLHRVPILLVTKIFRTFQDPRSIFSRTLSYTWVV